MALEIKVTLGLYSKNHSLNDLIGILGEPVKGFSVGDKFSKKEKVRDLTYWSIDSSKEDGKKVIEDHLAEVLSIFHLKKNEFLKLKSEGCKLEIVCLMYSDNGQGGASIPSKLLGELYEIGIDLNFDIYANVS